MNFPVTRYIVLLLVGFFCGGQTVAAPADKRPFAELLIAAEKGEALAQRLVAAAYFTGEGAAKNESEGVKWLRRAVDQHDPVAQYTLGILHDEGRGVPRDLAEAVKWYRLAAEQGHVDAQYNLAQCYLKGDGVRQDYAQAVEWFRKAAVQGDAPSQTQLGLAYIAGKFVNRDYVEAVSWLRKAAYPPGADRRAQFFLGRLHQEGEGVDKDDTMAARWIRKSAEQGWADAQFSLGQLLLAGRGEAANAAEARKWFEQAAAQKHEGATKWLAEANGAQPVTAAAPVAKTNAPASAVAKSGPPRPDSGSRVGSWGEFTRLEFHGLRTYATNDVVNALLQSPDFLLAAHPAAPQTEFAPALQKALVNGYRNGGFRDARAVVMLDEARQRVRVEVTEGPRFRCGTVRVVNAKQLPVAEVVRRLTEKVPAQPQETAAGDMLQWLKAQQTAQQEDVTWKAGAVVPFDGPAADERQAAVEKVLASCGFHFAKLALRLEPQPTGDRMDLVVDVQAEGAAGKLGQIEVTGLTRHTPGQFLSWLGVKSGDPLAFDLVPKLEGRIADSGRFLTQRVTPEQLVGDAGQVNLKIEVREFTNSPLLGQAFSATEQLLLRTRAQTEAAFLRGEELVFESHLTNVVVGTNRTLTLNGRAQVVLRPDALAVLYWTGDTLERGFLTSTNGLLYVSTVSGRRFESPVGANVRATGSVRFQPNPDFNGTNSTSHFSAVFGMDKRPDAAGRTVDLSFEVAPGLVIHRARQPGMQSRREQDLVHLATTNEAWRIRAASGELVEYLAWSKGEEGGDYAISLRPQRGALAAAERTLRAAGAGRPNLLVADRPVGSAAGLLAAELAESPWLPLWLKGLEPTQVKPFASALQRLAMGGLLDPFDELLGGDSNRETFFIPTELPPPNVPALMRMFWGQISAWLHRFSQEHLPVGSWPATLTREGVMLFGGNPKFADPELTRILESPQTGPLGCLAAAGLLAQAGNEDGAVRFAERGLQRLSAEDFRRDAVLLLDIADHYTRRAGRPLAALSTLPAEELSALLSLLSPSARGFLLRALAALKVQPDRGLREVLEPLLADWWQGGLQNEVEAALRRTQGDASARAAAQKLFVQAVARLEGTDGAAANSTEAARLFRQAAQQGSAGAAYYLGVLHEKGVGVQRDFPEALKWFGQAATNGVIEAQMKLGDVYSNNLDTPPDLVAAAFWYRRAELNGNLVARAFGSSVEGRLTPEQRKQLTERLQAVLGANLPGQGQPRKPEPAR